MKSRKTAREIAAEVIEANRPLDYRRLRYIRRHYSTKKLHEWAVQNIEPFTDSTDSKQLIGRAASILIDDVMSEVY